LSNFWPAGGFKGFIKLQPGGQIRPHRPVHDINNTTINERTRARGLELPEDGVAALILEVDFCRIFGRRGGFKASLNCNRSGELDRTARSTTSTKPQPTSIRRGGGWNGRGMEWRHCF
jgi:hypothetical protein